MRLQDSTAAAALLLAGLASAAPDACQNDRCLASLTERQSAKGNQNSHSFCDNYLEQGFPRVLPPFYAWKGCAERGINWVQRVSSACECLTAATQTPEPDDNSYPAPDYPVYPKPTLSEAVRPPSSTHSWDAVQSSRPTKQASSTPAGTPTKQASSSPVRTPSKQASSSPVRTPTRQASSSPAGTPTKPASSSPVNAPPASTPTQQATSTPAITTPSSANEQYPTSEAQPSPTKRPDNAKEPCALANEAWSGQKDGTSKTVLPSNTITPANSPRIVPYDRGFRGVRLPPVYSHEQGPRS